MAGIFPHTTLKIGEILFELFECKTKCKYAFQFAARQATHHAFIAEQCYLGCMRLKRGLKLVKGRCRASRGESGCASV